MPRRYSMAKRAQAREDTRQRLMAAATDLVMAKGSANITMTAVAEGAEVSLRTAYNHFATVDALLAAVMATINEEFSALAPAPVSTHDQRPEQALRELVAQWFDELARQEARIGALITIRDSTELDEALAAARQIRLERVRAVLSVAEADGRLRVPVDEATAVAYVQTSYQTWVALVAQLGLTTTAAADLVARSIAAFALNSTDREESVSRTPLEPRPRSGHSGGQ